MDVDEVVGMLHDMDQLGEKSKTYLKHSVLSKGTCLQAGPE